MDSSLFGIKINYRIVELEPSHNLQVVITAVSENKRSAQYALYANWSFNQTWRYK